MPRHIDTEKEAQEYFDHNPSQDVVGFAMLDEEQLKQVEQGDQIEGEVTILEVSVNRDVERNLKKRYGQYAS